MTEQSEPYTAERSGRVNTPLGPATILGSAGDGKYVVMFSRRDFTPEDWLNVSPCNGPCVFRVYKSEELEQL